MTETEALRAEVLRLRELVAALLPVAAAGAWLPGDVRAVEAARAELERTPFGADTGPRTDSAAPRTLMRRRGEEK